MEGVFKLGVKMWLIPDLGVISVTKVNLGGKNEINSLIFLTIALLFKTFSFFSSCVFTRPCVFHVQAVISLFFSLSL